MAAEKSCRNCAHSTHDGSFMVGLVCTHTNGFAWVKSPMNGACAQQSGSVDENRRSDLRCVEFASKCQVYQPEG